LNEGRAEAAMTCGQGPRKQAMNGLPNADLDGLLRFWLALAPERPLPRRGDILPERDLRPWLGDLAIASVETNPLRFKARLVGTHIVNADRRDVTGLYLDEAFRDRYAAQILTPFEAAVRKAQAVYNEIRFGTGLAFTAAQLILPFAERDAHVDHLIIGFRISQGAGMPFDGSMIDEVADGRAERGDLTFIARPAPHLR
jgi:hypothetical protein